MIDIAVGVIIGVAFNSVIDTLVKKVLMPPISLLTNNINFQDKKWVLRDAVVEGGKTVHEQVAIEYGTMITVLLNFFIIAFCVFFIVRLFNRLRNNAQDPKNKKVTTPKDIQLLSDLKDIMQEQNDLLKQNQNLKSNSKK